MRLQVQLNPESAMRKPLAATSLQMPALGFGTAPIGNLYQVMSDEQALATVVAGLAQGMDYFDTAPYYGFGLSEARLGSSLRGQGNHSIISTKVGRLLMPTEPTERSRHGFVDAPALEPVFDYSYDAVMRSFESSLRRLQVDRIDILLAHDLGQLTHGANHAARFREFMDGGYNAMQELRTQKLITAIGLGTNEWQVCEQAWSLQPAGANRL
jgi:D-threo-aldose 1-dehydrogenase